MEPGVKVDASELGVDLDALTTWVEAQGLGTDRVVLRDVISGGTQNILLLVGVDGTDYVLRRPPVNKKPRDDETMRREMRLLGALGATDVPHPALVAACPDPSVLGAAFYLMQPLAAANPNVELPPGYVDSSQWRHRVGLEVAAAAAAIGDVDYAAVGLEDFGRVDGFLDRQVDRWLHQLQSYDSLDGYGGSRLPHAAPIAAWLDQHRPRRFSPGLIHGDFHLANVMVEIERPAVAGVIDWELSTLGAPLIDLGWLLATWPDGDPRAPGVKGAEPWEGFPTAAELVEEYARRTDRSVDDVEWYTVLACFKLACILEGTYARAQAGLVPPERGERFRLAARNAMARAVHIIDK